MIVFVFDDNDDNYDEQEIVMEFIQQHFELLKTLRVKSKVDISLDHSKQRANEKELHSFDVFSHDWTFVQGSLQTLQLANDIDDVVVMTMMMIMMIMMIIDDY